MKKGFHTADVLAVLLFLDLLCLAVAACGLATAPTEEPGAACENYGVPIPPRDEQDAMIMDMLLHD